MIGRFSRNTIVERLFSASKNIMTDKRNSLNEDKLDKLLFLKRKSAYLKRNKEKRIDQASRATKTKCPVTDHESALSINESENLASSLTSKKVKRRNEDDNESDDNDPNEILADNDE